MFKMGRVSALEIENEITTGQLKFLRVGRPPILKENGEKEKKSIGGERRTERIRI